MGEQRIEGNRNVQIQGVVGSRIQITYDSVSGTVPLEAAHVPVAQKLRSPARLIRAHAGVTPYVDRGGLVGELEAWIDSPAPFAGQVIGGRGGSGKTRLAVELCMRLEESHWLCGFLARRADPAMFDALVRAPTARLIVIDYAETRPEQLELLLPLLSARAEPTSPVRVLLLVRGASGVGGWAGRLADRVDSLDAVLDECETRQLEETPFGPADRQALFEEAIPALVARLDPDAGPAPPPDLTQEVFASPLMVVVAAYLAAQGERAPTTREELLDEVLAHERRYWREGSAELGAQPVLLQRIVAVATLLNAGGESEAAEYLRVLTDLHDATAERRNELARWVRVQYPGPRWWNPLEPDLVGEHLVAKCFTDQPEVLRDALTIGGPEAITRPLEVLSRAAVDHPELAKALGPVLGDELERLCGVAVEQAGSVRDADLLYGKAVTVAAAINALLAVVEVDPEKLIAAIGRMPSRSDLVLNELAASLIDLRIRDLRPLAEAGSDAYAPSLAGALNNLSNRLSDSGRHPEALKASEESVAAWNALAQANPTHAPNLARALNNLSLRLSVSGRHPEALKASEETVAAWRSLTEANPTYAPNLARALNNVSLRLSDSGRHPEALKAGEESVAAWSPLAEADPAAYAPNLARALNNFSNRLAEAGRHPEALKASEESVAGWRRLAEENPAAYAPNLAMAFSNLSNRLAKAGRHPEALKAGEESVAAWRPLVEANPGAHAPNLARALNNFSNRLAEAGCDLEALKAGEEAVVVWRSLVEGNLAAHAPNLARALNNLSNRLSDSGRHPEALKASEESVAAWNALAEANPTAHAPSRARALNNFSNRLAEAGRDSEALKASEESVAAWRSLAQANPEAYAPNLAMALKNHAVHLSNAGRGEEAEAVRQEVATSVE